jgi:hypothetical protein
MGKVWKTYGEPMDNPLLRGIRNWELGIRRFSASAASYLIIPTEGRDLIGCAIRLPVISSSISLSSCKDLCYVL